MSHHENPFSQYLNWRLHVSTWHVCKLHPGPWLAPRNKKKSMFLCGGGLKLKLNNNDFKKIISTFICCTQSCCLHGFFVISHLIAAPPSDQPKYIPAHGVCARVCVSSQGWVGRIEPTCSLLPALCFSLFLLRWCWALSQNGCLFQIIFSYHKHWIVLDFLRDTEKTDTVLCVSYSGVFYRHVWQEALPSELSAAWFHQTMWGSCWWTSRWRRLCLPALWQRTGR